MTMSIEEYRAMEMTEREEWEANFNGKRCSIEAIDSIIIKKRGTGPEKPNYTHESIEPGPYYDPQGIHLHIWKNKKNIRNFTGEQNPNVRCLQFTDDKPGYYCSICHLRNKSSTFKWVHALQKPLHIPEYTKKHAKCNSTDCITEYISPPSTSCTRIEIGLKKLDVNDTRYIKKWTSLMSKVLHTLKFKKIEYKISNTKLLYLWPWELTPYQRFKLKCPDYKKSNIFLNTIDTFTENYAYII